MKSKTEEWDENHGFMTIPIYPGKRVFYCEIDSLRRPSAIPGAKQGQKCIVILL